MLRRLLDRLAELVNVEPSWADFGDVEWATDDEAKVDIAFDSTYSTLAEDRTWTDVTDFLRG